MRRVIVEQKNGYRKKNSRTRLIFVCFCPDPVTTQGGVRLICGSIFSGLVAQDFDLNPVPDLAERWEISEEGKTYTFYLAKNAELHDGVPVTSADVKRFHLKYIYAPSHAKVVEVLRDQRAKSALPLIWSRRNSPRRLTGFISKKISISDSLYAERAF